MALAHYVGQSAGNGIILLRKLHGWDFKTACDEADKIIGTDYRPIQAEPSADIETSGKG